MAITATTRRVQAARTALLLDQPFFGVLALQLALQEDPTCDTAWTDGRSLGYAPAFVATLTDDQLRGLVAHEVLHCAGGHPWRRDARDAKQWNIACDHAINNVLRDAGFVLPDGGMNDPQWRGQSSEYVYDRLPAPQPDPNGAGAGADPGGCGEVRDAPTGTPDTPAPTQADWQAAVQQAAATAGRGAVAGAVGAVLQLAAPRVDWRSLLRRYVQESSKADYTWTRPNVRYLASGLYLPSLNVPACGRLTIAVDTSGSIDTVLLSQFASEVRAIADDLQPSSVQVIYCDTRVHRSDVFERGDYIDIHAIGRGGTSFAPVFEHVAADGDVPACLIYLTDLDGSFPDAAPDYPVIWAAYGRHGTAPFGDTVHCD